VLLERVIRYRGRVVTAYLAVSAVTLVVVGSQVGREIFPAVDTG